MVDIKTINQEGVEILVVVGEIDASSSIQLDEALGGVIDNGAQKILVDCTQLEYISSAGLGVFMSYVEEVNSREAKMILCGLNEKVMNVFELLGLDQLLETKNTKEEALEALK